MINQSNIFKKIGYILNELQDQYQFLSENPEQLSELELELFLANANFLSDHVEIVRKLNSNKPLMELPQHIEEPVNIIPQEVNEPEVTPDEPLIEQIEREELQQEDLSPTFEFVIDQESAIEREEEIFEPAEQIVEPEIEVVEEETEDPAPEPYLLPSESVAESESESESVAPSHPQQDIFAASVPAPEVAQSYRTEPVLDKVEEKIVVPPSTEPVLDKVEEKVVQPMNFNPAVESNQPSPAQRPTLNDLLAGKSGSAQPEEPAKPAITDLKRSITLNVKRLYIKDLFNGYNLPYSEAIDLVNKMPDLKTADAFLKNNYALKNNWEAKQSTVAQFYELLKQRFPEG